MQARLREVWNHMGKADGAISAAKTKTRLSHGQSV